MKTFLEISPKKLQGNIVVPPSKSIAHRYLICAALSDEKSKISNIQMSSDVKATIEGLKQLQLADFIEDVNTNSLEVIPLKNRENKDRTEVYCNESGSTLRFLIAVSLINDGEYSFTGNGRLFERPLDVYINLFKKMGITYKKENCTFKGQLKSGNYMLPANVSSQFISGLLFAFPLLDGDSVIEITTEVESKGYIALTLQALKEYGIEVEHENYKKYYIKGNQKYTAKDAVIEADYSQAAFFLVANALGSNINCENLNSNSLQGDKCILDILKEMGPELKAVDIDVAQCPDLVPILAVLTSFAKGTSKIYNAQRLRLKESDRLKSISCELNKLGGNIIEKEDCLIVNGIDNFTGGEVDSWNDHRIAMAIAIAATRCKDKIILNGFKSVDKSYPDFWDDYMKLGGRIL